MRIAVPNKGPPARPVGRVAGTRRVARRRRRGPAIVRRDRRPGRHRAVRSRRGHPEYVSDGAADAGITGLDQVREADPGNLEELLDLGYGSCKLVLAAPEDGDIESVEDLAGGTVATEFPNVTRNFFDEKGSTSTSRRFPARRN